MGVDIVVYLFIKYIGGYSDVVVGVFIICEVLFKDIFFKMFLLNGVVIGFMDVYLIECGLWILLVRLV